MTLSNLYITEERFEEVITILNDLEETDHPYAEWNLAKAYNELEDFAVAKVHYEQAAQELSHEPEFLKNTHCSYEKKANLKNKTLVIPLFGT